MDKRRFFSPDDNIPDELMPEPPSQLIFVQGGKFAMGSNDWAATKPIHPVTLNSFYISPITITQEQWIKIMGTKLSSWNEPHSPATLVNWFQAVEYCNARSIKEELTPCYKGSGKEIICDWVANGYRLPTEAEWEFAARGGIFSHGYTYSGGNAIDAVAWYTVNAANASHPVGTKAPNELGLYDMSGNIREFVWDISANYPTGDQTDPTGPATGVFRVRRGGGWWDTASACEVSARSGNTPTTSHQSIGFRVARRTY